MIDGWEIISKSIVGFGAFAIVWLIYFGYDQILKQIHKFLDPRVSEKGQQLLWKYLRNLFILVIIGLFAFAIYTRWDDL